MKIVKLTDWDARRIGEGYHPYRTVLVDMNAFIEAHVSVADVTYREDTGAEGPLVAAIFAKGDYSASVRMPASEFRRTMRMDPPEKFPEDGGTFTGALRTEGGEISPSWTVSGETSAWSSDGVSLPIAQDGVRPGFESPLSGSADGSGTV